MTNEEILKLAKICGFDEFVGERDDGTQSNYWDCWEEQLLKFALTMHEDGYKDGYDRGYSEGYEHASYEHSGY